MLQMLHSTPRLNLTPQKTSSCSTDTDFNNGSLLVCSAFSDAASFQTEQFEGRLTEKVFTLYGSLRKPLQTSDIIEGSARR